MKSMTDKQKRALEKAKSIVRYASSHPSIMKFMDNMKLYYRFNDGDQWEQHDIDELLTRGQRPVTINFINSMVNALCGVEIQTRYKVSIRSHFSGSDEDNTINETVKYLSHYFQYIQDYQDGAFKYSTQFKDAVICGLGWISVFKDEFEGYIVDRVHPNDILFDPDDLTPQMTNQKFVARKIYVDREYACNRWDCLKEYYSEYGYDELYGGQSSAILDRSSSSAFQNTSNSGSQLELIEVQYREPANVYRGYDSDGKFFETFDKKEALEISKEEDIEINKNGSRIIRVLYTDSLLLEFGPLRPSIPSTKDFSYIPCVMMRKFDDGVPYGLVHLMMDPQREINARHAKALYLAGSKSVIADSNAFVGRDIEQIRKEIKRSDSVFIKTPNSDFRIVENNPLAETQMRFLEKNEQNIQSVSGIHSDFLGAQTNAQSGVAIRQRQVQSVRNHIYAFDALRYSKKRFGEHLLKMIQGSGDENMLAQILTEDENSIMIINRTYTVDGKKKMYNDIRYLPISLYIEDVPDAYAFQDEQKASFESIASHPMASIILKSPELMKLFMIKDGAKIAEAIKKAEESSMKASVGAQQQPSGGAMSVGEQALNESTVEM
jgi:hypothetical protein